MNKSDQITYKALEHYAAELKQELDDVHEQMKHLNLNGTDAAAQHHKMSLLLPLRYPDRVKPRSAKGALPHKTSRGRGRTWTAEQRADVGRRIKRYWQKRREAK
jgi:hypothetical protein